MTEEKVWTVVMNDEEQYSVWEADRELPAGWRSTGRAGSREACLAHIDEVWTDLPACGRRWTGDEQGAPSGADGRVAAGVSVK
jgi:MbtH protein